MAEGARARGGAQNPAPVKGSTVSIDVQAGESNPVALDPIIHVRVRLGIVSALAVEETLTFNELKERLDTSDGNLSVHARRLEELTGVRALETQARYILGDLFYFQANQPPDIDRATGAMRWRIKEFLPMLERLRSSTTTADPVQAYCDVLHHRFRLSSEAGHDVGTPTAVDDWFDSGQPGYPLKT